MEHIHEYNAAVTKLKMILDGEQMPTLNQERTENVNQNRGNSNFLSKYENLYIDVTWVVEFSGRM